MQFIRFIVTLLLLLFSSTLYAWNAMGHEIVAAIAFDQLTPKTREGLAKDLHVANDPSTLKIAMMHAAIWPDQIKDHIKAFNNWHYIDLPAYASDYKKRYRKRFAPTPNAVWAILHAQTSLHSAEQDPTMRRFFLRFLLHLIGDLHQPLHCIERYSAALPKGDQGGNLVHISDPNATNLHALWDQGVGLFYNQSMTVRQRDQQAIKRAKRIETSHKKASFQTHLAITAPNQWAKEGYAIATRFAYTLSKGQTPSKSYYVKGHIIVQQQLALAGYRLANTLNTIYANERG